MKSCDVLPLSCDYDLIAMDYKIQHHEASGEDHLSYYEHFKSMNLPSLIPLYIFLARFPLDYTHESLRLRLEQQIENPSLPIIRQVINILFYIWYIHVGIVTKFFSVNGTHSILELSHY